MTLLELGGGFNEELDAGEAPPCGSVVKRQGTVRSTLVFVFDRWHFNVHQ